MRQKGEILMLDVNKLKGKITENGLNITDIAKALNINPSTFYRKMKKNSFEIGEVDVIVDKLKLSREDANSIFFSQPVA